MLVESRSNPGTGPVGRRLIGDALVLFEDTASSESVGRFGDSSWVPNFSDGSFRVLSQPPSERWNGWPAVTGERGPWRYWMLGEFYGEARRDPHIAVGEMLDGGAPDTLNGHFAILAWHSGRRQLTVWTDRFGTVHLYHARNGKRAAVGTFSPAVASAASRRELDWEGITGFFACGFFPGDLTFFSDVRLARPASRYTFDEEGQLLSGERYWRWWYEPDTHRSYDDTVRELGSILDRVLDEQTDEGSIGVPVSGGLDSRTTVASVTRSGRTTSRLWPFSYGYDEASPELSIAGSVAETRGLPLHRFVIEPYLFEDLTTILDSVEGFQDLTQCRQAAIRSPLRSNADYVIAAHWGDVWLDSMGLPDREVEAGRLVKHATTKVLKGGRQWLLDRLCRPRLPLADADDVIPRLLRQEIESLPELGSADFQLKALKTDVWSFRWTLTSLRMYQPAAFPRLPFYDTRLTDFMATVPSAYLEGRRLQVDYLKRHAPDLAAVEWQAHGKNLFRYQDSSIWDLPGRAVRKAFRVLRNEHPIERNWEIQLLSDAGRRGVKELLLARGLRLHDFVSPAEIEALLRAFHARPLEQKRGYTVSMLVSFSAWLERYG